MQILGLPPARTYQVGGSGGGARACLPEPCPGGGASAQPVGALGVDGSQTALGAAGQSTP